MCYYLILSICTCKILCRKNILHFQYNDSFDVITKSRSVMNRSIWPKRRVVDRRLHFGAQSRPRPIVTSLVVKVMKQEEEGEHLQNYIKN